MMETTDVLKQHETSITIGAGGGGAGFDGNAAGGALRLRLGVGARQEVRVEGTALWHDSGGQPTPEHPWEGKQ